MRLVDRVELMTLPKGTIYMEWSPCILGALMVKEETCKPAGENIDWFENPLGPVVNLTDDGFELNNAIGREGCFDPKLRYLVMEAQDIAIMIRKLQGLPIYKSTELTPTTAEFNGNGG